MLERATAIAEQHRRSTTRRLVAVAVAIATLLAAGAAYLYSREPSRALDVGCYQEARLPSTVFVVPASGSPAEACRRVWRGGAFSPTPIPAALTACVLRPGTIGVFPGGPEVCGRLGLPEASDIPPRRATAIAELRGRLSAASRDTECLAPEETRVLVQRALADIGLDGWTVDGGGFTTDRPCATFSIDEPGRRVVLVPSRAD